MGLLAVNHLVLRVRKIIPPGQRFQRLGQQEGKDQGPMPRD